jgi:phospholipid N-methyltransferase
MERMMTESRVQTANEIKQFSSLWKGGYFAGDPLEPVGKSQYGDMGYISSQHAIYQVCIRPYVKSNTRVLEIGPGRGAWTKTMLNAKEIWCLDALSAEYNRFWTYVGNQNRDKIRYLQVNDFSCKQLPDNYFDFMFSYGTFCHITWDSQREYYKNLYPKLVCGASAMVMFADFDKYNSAIMNYRRLRVRKIDGNIVLSSLKDMLAYARRYCRNRLSGRQFPQLLDKNDTTPAPAKWCHAGICETSEFLESLGCEVVNSDVGLNLRDPIIHFRKP